MASRLNSDKIIYGALDDDFGLREKKVYLAKKMVIASIDPEEVAGLSSIVTSQPLGTLKGKNISGSLEVQMQLL